MKGLLKVLLCERWVGDWTELQHIDPHSYGHNSVSFPFSWAAQPGAWRLSLCWDMILIPASSLQLQLLNRGSSGPLCWVLVLCTASYLQLIWTSCRRGYIIIWRSLFFLRASQFRTQFNSSTVKVAPDTFDQMHLLFTQVHFLFWQLGRGQYATITLSFSQLDAWNSGVIRGGIDFRQLNIFSSTIWENDIYRVTEPVLYKVGK